MKDGQHHRELPTQSLILSGTRESAGQETKGRGRRRKSRRRFDEDSEEVDEGHHQRELPT